MKNSTSPALTGAPIDPAVLARADKMEAAHQRLFGHAAILVGLAETLRDYTEVLQPDCSSRHSLGMSYAALASLANELSGELLASSAGAQA